LDCGSPVLVVNSAASAQPSAVRRPAGRGPRSAPISLGPVLGTFAGVVVGLTLVVAGVLKLAEGPTWLKQAADMGVSRLIAQIAPFAEIVIGVPLVGQVLEPWPAVAALALLVVFTFVVVRRLLDGSRPPCGCFGTRSKRPLGAYHVVRNLGLVLVAVVAVVSP
jgi:Methylamine utilisation protein MauE